MNKQRINGRYGFSLVEMLVASVLIAACLGGILSMAVGGRKSTIYEVRYLQALTIAKSVNRELDRAAISDLSLLPSESNMLPLIANNGKAVSSYALRLFQDRTRTATKFPELVDNLDNFRISVTLSSFQVIDEIRTVTIVVFFKSSRAQKKWNRLTFSSVITRHSPV